MNYEDSTKLYYFKSENENNVYEFILWKKSSWRILLSSQTKLYSARYFSFTFPLQGLSVLSAMALRALGPNQCSNYDSDEEFPPDRLPLINNHAQQPAYVIGDSPFANKNEAWNVRILSNFLFPGKNMIIFTSFGLYLMPLIDNKQTNKWKQWQPFFASITRGISEERSKGKQSTPWKHNQARASLGAHTSKRVSALNWSG